MNKSNLKYTILYFILFSLWCCKKDINNDIKSKSFNYDTLIWQLSSVYTGFDTLDISNKREINIVFFNDTLAGYNYCDHFTSIFTIRNDSFIVSEFEITEACERDISLDHLYKGSEIAHSDSVINFKFESIVYNYKSIGIIEDINQFTNYKWKLFESNDTEYNNLGVTFKLTLNSNKTFNLEFGNAEFYGYFNIGHENKIKLLLIGSQSTGGIQGNTVGFRIIKTKHFQLLQDTLILNNIENGYYYKFIHDN